MNSTTSFNSNNINMDNMPEPKYKVRQFIKLSRDNIGMIDYLKWGHWLDNPQWVYYYSYGLGGTSEASIIESRIKLKQ